MKTCTFIYKCRKCNKEYEGSVGGETPARYGLMTAVYDIPYSDKFIGIPPKMYNIHHCENGNFVGVADLIGYRIDETKNI